MVIAQTIVDAGGRGVVYVHTYTIGQAMAVIATATLFRVVFDETSKFIAMRILAVQQNHDPIYQSS